jgi:hypothetical protein
MLILLLLIMVLSTTPAMLCYTLVFYYLLSCLINVSARGKIDEITVDQYRLKIENQLALQLNVSSTRVDVTAVTSMTLPVHSN